MHATYIACMHSRMYVRLNKKWVEPGEKERDLYFRFEHRLLFIIILIEHDLHESLLSRRRWSSRTNPPRKTVLAALETSLSTQLVPLKPHLRRQPRLLLLFKPSNLHFSLFNFNINNFNNNTLIDSNCLGFEFYLKNKRRKTFTRYQLILHILILFKCTLMFVVMFMFCFSMRASGKIGYTNWVTLLK